MTGGIRPGRCRRSAVPVIAAWRPVMEQPNQDPSGPQPGTPPQARKRGTNVPAAVVTGVICLGLGIGAGMLIGAYVNERDRLANAGPPADGGDDAKTGGKGPTNPMGGPGGGKGGPGGGKGGKGGKGGPGGGFGGGGGPGGGGPGGGGGGNFSKLQLAQLVTVLDALTAKPLSVQLTPEQAKHLKEELAGLESKEELSNQDAQAKLTALLKVVEPNKDTI